MATTASTPGDMQTSIQDSSAHLFVPYSAGPTRSVADDSRKPGAYLRLGGYSGIEANAVPKKGQIFSPNYTGLFYPRQHKLDEGDNVVKNAAGDPSKGYKGGIMLSCDGRMLMRASERFYLHSIAEMHIDTESTLTVFANKAISVKTDATVSITTVKGTTTTDEAAATANSITIDAAGKKGNVDIKAFKATRSVAGNDYEFIDTDKYTYTQADTYAYKLGHAESVTLGDSLSFFMGATYTFKVSVEITIALAALILLYMVKFEVGLLKMDFQKFKLEYKEGNFSWSNWSSKARNIWVKAAVVDTNTQAVKKDNTGVDSQTKAVDSTTEAVGVGTGGTQVWVKGVINAV